jgi:hypothetical protein
VAEWFCFVVNCQNPLKTHTHTHTHCVAGIVTRLHTGLPRVRISKGARDFLLYKPSIQSFYSIGTGVLCPGCKAAGAWGWPLTSISFTEVKNEWSCISAASICFQGADRDSFALTLFPWSSVMRFHYLRHHLVVVDLDELHALLRRNWSIQFSSTSSSVPQCM